MCDGSINRKINCINRTHLSEARVLSLVLLPPFSLGRHDGSVLAGQVILELGIGPHLVNSLRVVLQLGHQLGILILDGIRETGEEVVAGSHLSGLRGVLVGRRGVDLVEQVNSRKEEVAVSANQGMVNEAEERLSLVLNVVEVDQLSRLHNGLSPTLEPGLHSGQEESERQKLNYNKCQAI